MKAIRFHKTGGPEVLIYEDVPMPEPEEGEVLIRVEAAGVNFADITRRRGGYYPEQTAPPYTLGAEVVGTISALAAEAHRLVEGRKSTGKVVLDPWASADNVEHLQRQV
ncbi:MAG: alcohol dehydrogenase catalytic domain-containing protein [Ferruginibacter sp.]